MREEVQSLKPYRIVLSEESLPGTGYFDYEEKELAFSLEPTQSPHSSVTFEPHVVVAHEFGHYKAYKSGEQLPGQGFSTSYVNEANAWRHAIAGFKKSGNYTEDIRQSAIDALQTEYSWGFEGYQVEEAGKFAEKLVDYIERNPDKKVTRPTVRKIAKEVGFVGGTFG